ncbi:MAG: galactonate dehydratase [Armatimonadota bacterium]
MRITRLETIHVKPRWLFLKVHTDEGIVGLGEPVVEGRAQTVEAAVHEAGRYLIGQDPRRIEHHWQAIYRGAFYRGGPVLCSALSGIEQALWDIFGKWLGVPVYQLLGGAVRDRIRLYRWVKGNTPDACAASARNAVAEGFTTLKTALFDRMRILDRPDAIDAAVTKFAAMREAVGREVQIAVDFHGRTSPAMAIRLARALEPYEPMFIEEPVLPENVDALAVVARATSVPIATGERLFTRWGFRKVLEKQAAAIIQPDLSHAGGILETRKISALAETYYVGVAPHCPLGPIALAACLQLDACIPNFVCQEHATTGEGYLKQPFQVRDGHVDLPSGPGLGIELDEESIRQKRFAGDWDNPLLIDEDGAVADW